MGKCSTHRPPGGLSGRKSRSRDSGRRSGRAARGCCSRNARSEAASPRGGDAEGDRAPRSSEATGSSAVPPSPYALHLAVGVPSGAVASVAGGPPGSPRKHLPRNPGAGTVVRGAQTGEGAGKCPETGRLQPPPGRSLSGGSWQPVRWGAGRSLAGEGEADPPGWGVGVARRPAPRPPCLWVRDAGEATSLQSP